MPNWESEIINQLGLQTVSDKFVQKLMLLRKNEGLSLQFEGTDAKFGYQRLLWSLCNNLKMLIYLCNNLKNANIGGFYSLSNKSNLIVALCSIKDILLVWKKMNGTNFLPRVILFFWVVAPCHKPPSCQIWCPCDLWNWRNHVSYLSWN